MGLNPPVAQRRRTLLRYTLWILLSMVANRLFYYIDPGDRDLSEQ